MTVKNILLVVVFVLVTCSLVFAGDLIAPKAEDYFHEGVKAQKEGQWAAAVAFYSKSKLVDPMNADYEKYIINNAGVRYIKEGDIEKAEAAFRDALRLDPSYRPAQLNLGLILDMCYPKLAALEYWLKVYDINLDQIKPKSFVLEELIVGKK